jgi:hypothetical protein
MEGTCEYTNKLLQIADNGCPPVWMTSNTSALKKACYDMLHKASGLNGHFWNDLHNKEIGVRTGPWNVRFVEDS